MIVPKTYALYRNLFAAYYSARKHKRNKKSQLSFEFNFESNLVDLYQDIVSFNYEPLPPNVFVTRHPVIREIFAPQFRDRIVHHLIYDYIYHHLDRKFIYDSYSCRRGKGTGFGVKRVERFMRSVSRNYTQDAYVLKLDVQGYFMQMNRNILLEKIGKILDIEALPITKTERKYLGYLIEKVVLCKASDSPVFRSPRSYWDKIPKRKSLFHSPPNCGMPIGSLTSQLFSNVYLNDLDHYIKSDLKVRYYGRYVDDMIFMHPSKEFLYSLIGKVDDFLQNKCGLNLHPKKSRLEHYRKGVEFLGRYILPGRIYLSRRCKKQINNYASQTKDIWDSNKSYVYDVLAPVNSYLGILSESNLYHLQQKFLSKLPQDIFYFYQMESASKTSKIVLKEEFNKKNKHGLFALVQKHI